MHRTLLVALVLHQITRPGSRTGFFSIGRDLKPVVSALVPCISKRVETCSRCAAHENTRCSNQPGISRYYRMLSVPSRQISDLAVAECTSFSVCDLELAELAFVRPTD